jgi:hypothetical protein
MKNIEKGARDIETGPKLIGLYLLVVILSIIVSMYLLIQLLFLSPDFMLFLKALS